MRSRRLLVGRVPGDDLVERGLRRRASSPRARRRLRVGPLEEPRVDPALRRCRARRDRASRRGASPDRSSAPRRACPGPPCPPRSPPTVVVLPTPPEPDADADRASRRGSSPSIRSRDRLRPARRAPRCRSAGANRKGSSVTGAAGEIPQARELLALSGGARAASASGRRERAAGAAIGGRRSRARSSASSSAAEKRSRVEAVGVDLGRSRSRRRALEQRSSRRSTR